jgi:hypothetical protein
MEAQNLRPCKLLTRTTFVAIIGDKW